MPSDRSKVRRELRRVSPNTLMAPLASYGVHFAWTPVSVESADRAL